MIRRRTDAGNRDHGSTFGVELVFWSWRVVVCAAPSFYLALSGGFQSKPEISAMLAGIATWVGMSAAATGSDWVQSRPERGRVRQSIRRAANVRVGWAVLAGLTLAAAELRLRLDGLIQFFGLTVSPDFLGGAVAAGTVATVAATGASKVADFDSFLLTYGITLLQGAWVVLTLLVIAGVLLLFERKPKTPN